MDGCFWAPGKESTSASIAIERQPPSRAHLARRTRQSKMKSSSRAQAEMAIRRSSPLAGQFPEFGPGRPPAFQQGRLMRVTVDVG